MVLPDALHSLRSLLCTTTNSTPHERFFAFPRRSTNDSSLPNWLLEPGPVLLRNFVRSKSDPLCHEVELINANTKYALIRHGNGKESTVSVTDLAPCPRLESDIRSPDATSPGNITPVKNNFEESPKITADEESDQLSENDHSIELIQDTAKESQSSEPLRRSTRIRRAPDFYGDVVSH